MKSKCVFLLILCLNSGLWAQPLPTRNTHSVIIDTDCGIDDFRAISILLSRPEITVKAITLSDGSLPPHEGAKKIGSLLNEFNINSIPVACGNVVTRINPPWRQFNLNVKWGSDTNRLISDLYAVDLLAEKLRNTDEKLILVCLGPLTNVAQLVKKDAYLMSEIERIIWYSDSENPLKGFNYDIDKTSADIVLNSNIRIDLISNLNIEESLFDSSMFDICRKSRTELAKVLYYIHSQKVVHDKLNQNHFRLCDDLVALYLTNPELFDINIMTDKLNVRFNTGYDVSGVKEAIIDMINGTYVSERNVVFKRFPVQRDNYNYDVRRIIDSAINRYGYDEWKATVMTDEFHGHLGVFSIVGAKMGIKARELFGVGPDMLEVTTFAGVKPPYSCMNDGIQVSTGATLGMGTIHLASDQKAEPSAVFTYKGRSVRISLKKEYQEKVDADINEGIIKFGLMDDGYWKLIRNNALKYWVEWDRNKIFDVVEIN